MRSADEGLWIALHRLLPTPPSEQSCYLRELFFQCWDQRHSGGLCCSPMCVYLCVCSPTFAEKRGGCNRFQLLIYQCFSFSLRDSFNGEALASFVASQNLSFAHIIGRLQLTSGHCGSVSSIGGALQGQWAQMWCKKPTETALQVPGSEGRRCCGCCSRYWLPCGHHAGTCGHERSPCPPVPLGWWLEVEELRMKQWSLAWPLSFFRPIGKGRLERGCGAAAWVSLHTSPGAALAHPSCLGSFHHNLLFCHKAGLRFRRTSPAPFLSVSWEHCSCNGSGLGLCTLWAARPTRAV